MKKKEKKNKTELGGLFYPTKDQLGNDISFDSLYIPYIYREIYFEGIYTDVMNQGKEMTILDVGSNIGVTVQHFREHAKKVYAIEPSPEHFTALKKNKEFNRWNNVEIFNMALADQDGEMTLSQNVGNRTCNSLNNNYGTIGTQVKTMRFDTFFEENKIEKVDFMKLDVENYEDILLRSDGFKNVVDKIQSMEVEFHNAQWPLLVEDIVKMGFQARRYESSAIVVLFFK